LNRFEILRGVNISLMIPIAILAIISAYMSFLTLNYFFVIMTGLYIILFFWLKFTLGILTMRIHQEYFPKTKSVTED